MYFNMTVSVFQFFFLFEIVSFLFLSLFEVNSVFHISGPLPVLPEMMSGCQVHTGVYNPWPMGCIWPRMTINVAQHKIINLLKTVFISFFVFNTWPKTTLLLPVWPRDAKSLGTP